MKKLDFLKKVNQKEIIKQMNLIQGYIKESRDYFMEFEKILNDNFDDSNKLKLIKEKYDLFCSNHSMILYESK